MTSLPALFQNVLDGGIFKRMQFAFQAFYPIRVSTVILRNRPQQVVRFLLQQLVASLKRAVQLSLSFVATLRTLRRNSSILRSAEISRKRSSFVSTCGELDTFFVSEKGSLLS